VARNYLSISAAKRLTALKNRRGPSHGQRNSYADFIERKAPHCTRAVRACDLSLPARSLRFGGSCRRQRREGEERDVSLWDNPPLPVRTMGCPRLIWRLYYLTCGSNGELLVRQPRCDLSRIVGLCRVPFSLYSRDPTGSSLHEERTRPSFMIHFSSVRERERERQGGTIASSSFSKARIFSRVLKKREITSAIS